MKKLLLKVWEVVGGALGVAFVLWIWFSPGPPTEPLGTWDESGYYASREDFDALVREPDEEEQALERALETLHHNRK